IRYGHVTGVQTCALPISNSARHISPLAHISSFIQEMWRALLAVIMLWFFYTHYKLYIKASKKYVLLYVFVAVMAAMLIFFFLTKIGRASLGKGCLYRW